MIFVTVGTHEQQFNRLLEEVDRLKGEGKLQDTVFMQTGYSTYQPVHCEWKKMISFREMQEKIQSAKIVITHGGPSSFLAPLQIGKIPIVVPRRKDFGEHINNHQVDFVKKVHERQGNIIPVYDIKKLSETIEQYDRMIKDCAKEKKSNNAEFNRKLEEIVDHMFKSTKGKDK